MRYLLIIILFSFVCCKTKKGAWQSHPFTKIDWNEVGWDRSMIDTALYRARTIPKDSIDFYFKPKTKIYYYQ